MKDNLPEVRPPTVLNNQWRNDMQIHRTALSTIGRVFHAPENCQLGYQASRNEFSVWHTDDNGQPTADFIVLGTGHEFEGAIELKQTVVLPDGFHVFHLCKVLSR